MSPKIELLNVDCLEYMKTVPDKYFSLAICDPPYGIDIFNSGGKTSGWKKHEKKDWDDIRCGKDFFTQLFRVSINQIVWGANYYTEYLPPSMGWVVWDKMKDDFSLAHAELAFTSFDKRTMIFRRQVNMDKGFMNKDGGDIHPTQKPVKLYKWLLQNYATCSKCNNNGSMYEDVVGDGGSQMLVDCEWCEVAEKGRPKILDTHGGSMSIAIACHQMGFDLTLCEIDKDYYDAGVKRFKEQTMQINMFK